MGVAYKRTLSDNIHGPVPNNLTAKRTHAGAHVHTSSTVAIVKRSGLMWRLTRLSRNVHIITHKGDLEWPDSSPTPTHARTHISTF